jgi:hypothetical protein
MRLFMEKNLAEHLSRLRAESAKAQAPPRQIERAPDHFQKQVEREGRSPFSGGNFGGGTWGGRSRSEGEQP